MRRCCVRQLDQTRGGGLPPQGVPISATDAIDNIDPVAVAVKGVDLPLLR
jgi:hypothetical protein